MTVSLLRCTIGKAPRRGPPKAALVAIFLSASCGTMSPPTVRADDELFERRVRPLFLETCLPCHGGKKTESGLRVDSRQSLLAGGDRGPAIVPGEAANSLLVQAIRRAHEEVEMPPGKRLADDLVADVARWVDAGARWPDKVPLGESSETRNRAHWSFQSLHNPVLPVVRDMAWPTSPIDRFILARLEAKGLAPASGANKRTLLRRISFDLTGLPPTLDELEAFLSNESPDAFQRVVDRLLASPAYGERWARHWLDVARYADYYDANPKTRTASCESTEAWRYRDWVVDSFNSDLAFDQFVIHQIAGDLLPSPTGDDIYPAGLIATTFLANGVWDRGDADKEKIVSDMADDQIDTIGKAFLGLTLGCARCHDHKFDPISQADYYALAGIFYSSHILKELGTKGGEYTLNRVPLVPPPVAAQRERQLREFNDIQAKLAAFDKQAPPVPADNAGRLALVERRRKLQSELLPELPLAMAIQEGGTPGGLFPSIQNVPLHIRGSYARLGRVIPRGLPRFFAGASQRPITTGSGRRELAQWVASKDNPLTARVITNRLWQWHFGEGLVRTPSNFGLRGQPPSHPELLDWLAVRLIEDGWSLKSLHRRIVLSAAYRQAGYLPRERVAQDPDNRWFARFAPRRLEAEAIRDALLVAADRLDRTRGGPAGDDVAIGRRSLYVQTARWDRSSYAMLLDAANPDASVETRTVSTVAPQSLFLLNHDFVHAQAKRLAERLSEIADNDASRIQYAYLALFGREARAEEVEVCRRLLVQSPGPNGWFDVAHVLLCSNEFVYLD